MHSDQLPCVTEESEISELCLGGPEDSLERDFCPEFEKLVLDQDQADPHGTAEKTEQDACLASGHPAGLRGTQGYLLKGKLRHLEMWLIKSI